jgi:hypothetical protein
MDALALHLMIFPSRIVMEFLPAHFPVFPPHIAVSEQTNVVLPAKTEWGLIHVEIKRRSELYTSTMGITGRSL